MGSLNPSLSFSIVSGVHKKCFALPLGRRRELDNYSSLEELFPKFPSSIAVLPVLMNRRVQIIAESPDADVTYRAAVPIIAVDITGLRSPIQCNL